MLATATELDGAVVVDVACAGRRTAVLTKAIAAPGCEHGRQAPGCEHGRRAGLSVLIFGACGAGIPRPAIPGARGRVGGAAITQPLFGAAATHCFAPLPGLLSTQHLPGRSELMTEEMIC